MQARPIRVIFVLAAAALGAHAHIGSPDIYLDAQAGPYQLFVTVRPPTVIPGVAEVEVRSESAGVREIRVVPVPMTGAGAKFAPVADKLKESREDPQFFTGSLWMMAPGSWQVRLTAEGQQGEGVLAVPVPAAAMSTKKMQRPLGAILLVLALFLVAGLVAIVGASVREAKLEPGVTPDRARMRRSQLAMLVAFLVIGAVLWYGNVWWESEAASYREQVYKPLQMAGTLDNSGMLTLRMKDPGWMLHRRGRLSRMLVMRTMDDLVPDHDHLMHLYAIRQPGLDVVYHLHPELAQSGVFQLKLPNMPAGTYKLYADIVHANGFPETMVTTLQLPEGLKGRPLTGDDASGTAMPWERTSSEDTTFSLPDGYHMQWLRRPGTLKAKEPIAFHFILLDRQGRAPADMQLYMGMLGHAAFVKTDGTVFAHIHPTGSVSMAAFMLAQKKTPDNGAMAGMQMSGMEMPEMNHGPMNGIRPASPDALPNEVSFPYGFPTAGRYRIFVQMKHGGTIETGAFDAEVK